MDDSNDPWVTLKFQGCPEVVRFKASGEAGAVEISVASEMQKEIKFIYEAVHQAYLDSTRKFPLCFTK